LLIDLGDGKAQMIGSDRSTGGELDVRVTATDSGLHFAGIMRTGGIVMVSVFAALDPSGNYRAVMSRHGSSLDLPGSAEFYGSALRDFRNECSRAALVLI
jgi:hypothetical protein